MRKTNTFKRILVIGDPHARPDVDNSRFEILGKFIVDKRPDEIVCIGDFADMLSLSAYDRGTVKAEGKRYSDDIKATLDAQEKMFAPVRELQKTLIKGHKERYNPRFWMVMGNHDGARIARAANEHPAMYGHISEADLKYAEFGWNVIPFLEPLILEGIVFQHYFTSGVMCRAISGDNAAMAMVKKNHRSSVAGHSHLRQYWETSGIDGVRIFGLSVGCYDEGDHSYAKGSQHLWWHGLVMLNEVDGTGSAEPAFYSMRYLKQRYGKGE